MHLEIRTCDAKYPLHPKISGGSSRTETYKTEKEIFSYEPYKLERREYIYDWDGWLDEVKAIQSLENNIILLISRIIEVIIIIINEWHEV